MFSRITTSEENKQRITELTSKLQLGAENVIARLALSYSLAQDRKLDLLEIKDSKGKEYSKSVLFGEYLPFYIALVCQKYNIYKTNQEIPRYLKLHLDNGVNLIYEEINSRSNVTGIDYLINLVNSPLF